jgi:uncharacterized protein (DUF2235 family)
VAVPRSAAATTALGCARRSSQEAMMFKRLVICCDGTWNTGRENCPSNVYKIAQIIAPYDGDGNEQRVRYFEGVGTRPMERLQGGVFGFGLSRDILEAYRSLIGLYDPGDEIFLFGFSRGAYTARSTVGLIRTAGLPRREHIGKVSEAYELYRRRNDPAAHPTGVEATHFRARFSHEPRIRFIGVWDTVGSLGIPDGLPWVPQRLLERINRRWTFHDTDLSSTVDYAYQAIAIDERRPQFKPTLWSRQAHARNQMMEQVWFAGVHTDIGGGYEDGRLADITLQWMKEKAEGCRLAFHPGFPIGIAFDPDPLGKLHESKNFLYALFRDHIRPIGEKRDRENGELAGNEMVHRSALVRAGQVAYHPPNLT